MSKPAVPDDLCGWAFKLKISSCWDYPICTVNVHSHHILLWIFLNNNHLKMDWSVSSDDTFLLWLIFSHRECGSTAVTLTYIFAHIDLAWLCCHDDLHGPADSILLIVTKQVQRLNTFHFRVIDKSLKPLPDYPGTAGRLISTTFLLQFIRRCNS